jgi:hypothetical protein
VVGAGKGYWSVGTLMYGRDVTVLAEMGKLAKPRW